MKIPARPIHKTAKDDIAVNKGYAIAVWNMGKNPFQN